MATLKFYIKDSKAEKTNIYFFLNYGADRQYSRNKRIARKIRGVGI